MLLLMLPLNLTVAMEPIVAAHPNELGMNSGIVVVVAAAVVVIAVAAAVAIEKTETRKRMMDD